jgi:cysteinyl-tRNA synthetase
MSKSLGNIVNAVDFLSQYGGEVARMAFLSVHYRSPFDFSPETVDQAITNLERIYEAKKSAEFLNVQKMSLTDPVAESLWGGFFIDVDRARTAILDHYANDLNTSGALAEVFGLIREWNRILATGNARNTPAAILAAREMIKMLEEDLGSVIGVGRMRAETMLAHLASLRVLRSMNEGRDVLTDAEVEGYLLDRKAARTNKDFKRSDEIRDLLLSKGVEIKDSPQGTTWTRR